MKRRAHFVLSILSCLSATVAGDFNDNHYSSSPGKRGAVYSLKTGHSLVAQASLENDLLQFQQDLSSSVPQVSIRNEIVLAAESAQEENTQYEPLMTSMAVIRSQVASQSHQAMMTELKGRLSFLKDRAEGAETMEYVMVGKPKLENLMRQKAIESVAYNARFVPPHILAVVPVDFLNSCDFKPEDKDREKSIKMIRLGILIYGLSPQVLRALSINGDEKNFLSACCFKDAYTLMKAYLKVTPDPDFNYGSNEQVADRINDYAVAVQTAYWSLCRLSLSRTPKIGLLLQMKGKAERSSLKLKNMLFQLPERHPVREQYLAKLQREMTGA